MRKHLVVLAICFVCTSSSAQNVGIGTPNPQNKLHVAGGFRLDTLTAVGGPGLVWHNPNGVVYGIKLTGNTNDVLRGDGTFGNYDVNGSIGWLLNGNSSTNPATHFLGTIDNQPLLFKVNNIRHGYLGSSIFWGSNAGLANTGSGAVGIGRGALQNSQGIGSTGLVAVGDSALFNNIGNNPGINALGIQNTAIGARSLYSNSSGNGNTAIGALALEFNTTGSDNSAFGSASLRFNRLGSNNTAIGRGALAFNSNGNYNTAIGVSALVNNSVGSNNTAVGGRSLISNSSGSYNTAVGFESLWDNLSASFNSALGYHSLYRNETGGNNSAFGTSALENMQTGSYNSAFGSAALLTATGSNYNCGFGYGAIRHNVGSGNTAVGFQSLHNNNSGSWNTAVGIEAGFALSNNASNVTCLGSSTGWNTTISNQVNIGNFSVQWIGGQTGWFHYSDKRIKNDIKEDVPGLSFITRLKPITYRVDIDKQEEIANTGKVETNPDLIKPVQRNWEGKYDLEKIKMTGFFAQDVEEAAKAINYSFNGVYNPKNGGLLSLDYSAFVVPLVKAVQEQQATIEKQQKQIDDLVKRLEALEKK